MKIFVTGITSGVGRALVDELLKGGHEVWGVGRRRELIESILDDPRYERLTFTACDICDTSQVEQTIREMAVAQFTPDVVVLNAGIYESDLAEKFDYSKAQSVLRTNVEGVLVWVHQFLPSFEERDRGTFVVISSLAAFRPDARSCSYPASKAAVVLVFRSLRIRFKETKLRFKTICFGPIDTLVVPDYKDSKPGRLVVSAENAAQFVCRAINNKGDTFYYPRILGRLFRLLNWLPDRLFHALTNGFRR